MLSYRTVILHLILLSLQINKGMPVFPDPFWCLLLVLYHFIHIFIAIITNPIYEYCFTLIQLLMYIHFD